MPRIQEGWLKIKNVAEDALSEWGLIAIVFLVGLTSFGLGRLSAIEEARPTISAREGDVAAVARAMSVGGLVVASRKGSAYHYPWCPGAETIAAVNKIWFDSEKAAQSAGYAPAKNCKGLGSVSSD